MSMYVNTATEELGQFASNNGYSDLIEASKGDRMLKVFFAAGAANTPEMVEEVCKALRGLDDMASSDVTETANGLADLIEGEDLVYITDGTHDGDDVDKSVGGKVIDVVRVNDGQVWVNTVDAGKEECAVYCNPKGNDIKPGDSLWWQSGVCYWTSKPNGIEVQLPKIGFSGVERPTNKAYGDDEEERPLDENEMREGEADDEEPADKFEIRGSVVKFADRADHQHLVFGWFSIVSIGGEVVTDTQGDQITSETIEAASYEFVLDSRAAGEMHEQGDDGVVKGRGRVVESVVFTLEKQRAMAASLHAQGIANAAIDLGCVAWWGGFLIEDESTWAKVVSGELRAFSVGGRGKRAAV